jgi:hypothetical protein
MIASGPSPCPYSPECVELEFSEVRIQDLVRCVLIGPEICGVPGPTHTSRHYLLWCWIDM